MKTVLATALLLCSLGTTLAHEPRGRERAPFVAFHTADARDADGTSVSPASRDGSKASPRRPAGRLTERDLANVALEPPPKAAIPLDLVFRDSAGRRAPLRDFIGARPAVVLFADYTCETVCRPALAIAAGALADTGLNPNTDYRLLVVGLDTKDEPGDAKELLNQIGDPAVARVTSALMSEGSNVEQLTAAIGYRYAYDAQVDQFAHPAGAIVVTQAGRVSRTLSSLALNANDLRLALVEAGEGRVGGISDRLALLCYGFDAVHGVYTSIIWRLLEVATSITIILVAGSLLLLWRRDDASGARPT